MKAKELREKTKEELQRFLDEKKESLDKFRSDFNFGKNKNVKQGRSLRKDIARILTVINNRHDRNS